MHSKSQIENVPLVSLTLKSYRDLLADAMLPCCEGAERIEFAVDGLDDSGVMDGVASGAMSALCCRQSITQ